MENVIIFEPLLLDNFEIQELEYRLENKWGVVDDCACICDCKTGETPEKF